MGAQALHGPGRILSNSVFIAVQVEATAKDPGTRHKPAEHVFRQGQVRGGVGDCSQLPKEQTLHWEVPRTRQGWEST